MTATSLIILVSYIEKLNKLVTALIGSIITLELYIILLLFMIVYVVCNYTILNSWI